MPQAGSNFMDWQQAENESRLFVDDDFSWSEPPQRRRRRITEEPIRTARRTAVLEYESGHDDHRESGADYEPAPPATYPPATRQSWNQPTAVHSHFDEMMEAWNANYGSGADGFDTSVERAFDLSDPGAQASALGARRTVVITGHGDDRYLPAPRQRRSSELRFHERSSFSPDRAGLWAVLLGIALVIGAIAH